MKNIIFYTGHYPTKDNPAQAFSQTVAHALADRGVNCVVISPQSMTRQWKYHQKTRPTEWFDQTQNGSSIRILQPRFLSFGRKKLFGVSVTSFFRTMALRRAIRAIKEPVDAMYAHFWHCGIEGVWASRGKIPVIAVSGEETIIVDDECGKRITQRFLYGVRGLIAVSSKNMDESRSCGLLRYAPRQILLLNAVDHRMFHQMDKKEARAKLGLPQDELIGIFVGSFEERKGPNRVIEAMKKIPELKMLFVGTGREIGKTDAALHSGPVVHEEMPIYMNAADFFVLPTLAEGCCNAIVEAMACGLPIISSDRPFNDDLLNETNSLRIDPENVDAIAEAMRTLCDSPELRQRLSEGALATAAELQIEKRAEKILRFLEECIE